MAGFRYHTLAATLVCGLIVACALLALTAGEAVADSNATATPDNNTTITPTPVVTPTPVPTPTPAPAERQVFFNAYWDTDHVAVQVNNNGPAIMVDASIGSLSNKITAQVAAGANVKVSTLSADARSGDVVRYWFKAYENGTLIDSMDGNLQVEAKPTVPPETATLSGTVVDAVTNAPINGAEVTLTSDTYGKQYPSVLTDATGTFVTVSKMYPDYYTLAITADGYRTLTSQKVNKLSSGAQTMDNPIKMEPLTVISPTPTPTPTASSPVDAWLNLLYNPTVCISTIAVALGGLVSATAIYEWTLRQRERRKKDGGQK